MIELLAPAGNMEKLKTAVHFGCDAVYLAGKEFGLRAFSDNFDYEELKAAVDFCHERGKKVYVTVNILAHNRDFVGLDDYIKYLKDIKVDGFIVSDPGIIEVIKKLAPEIEIHISTQANVTNKYSAAFWASVGASRIVLARELSLEEIKEIRDFLPNNIKLEAFVHGAMCMAYSGRCLLSSFLSGRSGNRGECAQSCRWEYALVEKQRPGEYMPIEEDKRGSYILNSKDLNMIEHIDKLIGAGVTSLKIEGRIKSPYYVGGTVNAYRRAIDAYNSDKNNYLLPQWLKNELDKIGNREYTTGFYFGKKGEQNYLYSRPEQSYEFTALVLGSDADGIIVEMRNRFKVGDTLEIMSPGDAHNRQIVITRMKDEFGEDIYDANKVQQKVKIYTDIRLSPYDILRKKI